MFLLGTQVLCVLSEVSIVPVAAQTFFFHPPTFICYIFEVQILFPINKLFVTKYEIRRNISVCWCYLWFSSALGVVLDFRVNNHKCITWLGYNSTLDKVRSFILALRESQFLGHSYAFKVLIGKEYSTIMFKEKDPKLLAFKKKLFCYKWFIICSE